MTNKNLSILALIVLLGGLSLYFNRDWFASEVIQVSHRSISPRGGMTRGPAAKAPANPVVFLLNKNLRLTALKVVVVSDAETNKYPHPIWNLISDSNSVPIKEFIYGTPIKGLKLAVKGVGADPLQPGTNYRLLIEAGAEKATHDFVPVPRTP
jgi:hypothetical protein